MDCKHYLVGSTWMTEDTLKMKLKDGLLQEYVNDGLVKPTTNVKPVELTEEQKQQSEEIKSLFKQPEPETKTEQATEVKEEPVAEKKTKTKQEVKPKKEVKSETTTETKQPNPIKLGEKLKDSKGIEYTVSQVDPMNKTFKAKHPGTGKELDFAIRENTKTGEHYAAEPRGATQLKLPDYVPERQVNEHERKVKFSDSKVSDAAQAIADKISWKPKDLIGKWSNARLSGYDPVTIFPGQGETIKTSKTITSTDAEGNVTDTKVVNSEIDTKGESYTFKTLGDYMTHLVGEGKMTMKEAKDIQDFLAAKEKQLTENNKAAEKAIKKENTLKSSIFALYYAIPEHIRQDFERRLNNLVVNAKYKIRDAWREARKTTIDDYTKLHFSPEQLKQLDEEFEKAISIQEKVENQKEYNKGSGLGNKNNFNFYEGFDKEMDGGHEYSDKKLFENAVQHLSDPANHEAVRNFISANARRYENGEPVQLTNQQVANVAVYKKILEDKLKLAQQKYFADYDKLDDAGVAEAWKQYEKENKDEEQMAKDIAIVADATRKATSSTFRLFNYLIGDDFNVERQESKEAKALGRPLNEKERRELMEIKRKYDKLNLELIEAQKKLEQASKDEKLQNYIDLLKKELEESKKNQGTGKEGNGTTGKEGNGTGKEGSGTTGVVGSGTTGLTGDGTTGLKGDGKVNTKPTVDKNDKLHLTKGYLMQFIEKGITEPEDLVKAVQSNLNSEHGIVRTDREIADLISGYGEKTITELSELDKALFRAKEILRNLSKIEDAKNNKKPLPQSGPQREKTTREKELRDELKSLLDKMELTPEEQAKIDAKKLDQVKKRLTERIRKQKATNRQIYDLGIPTTIGKDTDLKGNPKVPTYFTKYEAKEDYHDDVAYAMNSGDYAQGIDKGFISASDVMKILDSYGIEPSREINKRFKAEVKEARKNFNIPENVKRRLTLDQEALDKKIELAKIKEDSDYRLEKIRLAQRKPVTKIMDGFVNALSLPKSALSILDLSAPYRQGAVFLMSAPVRALFGESAAVKDQLHAFKQMHKFAYKPQEFEKYMSELKQDPLFHVMKECGLDLTESTKQEEEFFGNQFMNDIPVIGSKLTGGKYVQGVTNKYNKGLQIAERSGAAYSGFLNIQREQAFRKMYDMFTTDPNFDITSKEGMAQLKGAAQFINAATGRGKVSINNPEITNFLTRVFFSPKLIASRVQFIGHLFGAGMPAGLAKKYAAKQAWSYMAAQAAIIGLTTAGIYARSAGAPEDETEAEEAARKGTFDPYYVGDKNLGISFNATSTNFLKLKIGEKSFDFMSGFSMFPRAMAQFWSGKSVTQTGVAGTMNQYGDDKNWSTPIVDYLTNKVSPVTSELLGVVKRKNTAETKSGKEVIHDLFVPLILRDLVSNYENNGSEGNGKYVIGTLLNVGAIYGASVNGSRNDERATYEEQQKYLNQKLKEGDVNFIPKAKQQEILKGKPERKTAEKKQLEKKFSREKKDALRKMGINSSVRRSSSSSSGDFGNDFKSDFGNDFKGDF